MGKSTHKMLVVIEVTMDKPVPDIAEMIAQRGYTVDGVTGTRVVSADKVASRPLDAPLTTDEKDAVSSIVYPDEQHLNLHQFTPVPDTGAYGYGDTHR